MTPSNPIVWKLVLRSGDFELLFRRCLGLTFLERRLREALRLHVARVYVVAPAERALPPFKPGFCAPWLRVEKESDLPPEDRDRAWEVPVHALIEKAAPFRTRLTVASEEDFGRVEKILVDDLVRASATGWVGKKLNKPLSLFLSRRLAGTFVTPNLWSLVNLVIGLSAALWVAQDGYLAVLFGGFLLQLASVFDGVDGEIAKFRHESSPLGAWVDTAVDNLTLLAFLTGCGIHVYRYSPLPLETIRVVLILAALSVLTFLGVLFGFVRNKLGSASLASYDSLFMKKLPQDDGVVRGIRNVRHYIKKDFFSLLFFGLCALGLPDAVLLFSAFGPLVALGCVLYLNARYGDAAEAAGTGG